MAKDKTTIDLIARSYVHNKIILMESDMGYRTRSPNEVATSRYIVEHIEMVVRFLNDRDRFIIHHEVIEGKTGNWYLGQLSSPSYYRHRKEAYRTFIRNLNA